MDAIQKIVVILTIEGKRPYGITYYTCTYIYTSCIALKWPEIVKKYIKFTEFDISLSKD